MKPFQPELKPLPIGSLPHTDARQACDLVLEYFPEFPAWPQLPRRAFTENMYAQFSEKFPGVILEDERIFVDRTQDLDPALERLYLSTIEEDISYGELTPDYALGFHTFVDMLPIPDYVPAFLKGQVTGPISWGLSVVDQDRRPTLYDDVLADAIAKHLRLKARWQQDALNKFGLETILSVDEPFMASFGSAYVALNREQVILLMEEVLSAIDGLKMVHCCGNTDWSLLLDTSVDILSFDAFDYAVNLALYPDEIGAFLERGGMLAWGITPIGEAIRDEDVDSLVDKLVEAMTNLAQKGVHLDDMLRASFITPACGLGASSEELAERALVLTQGVSRAMRQRYA